MLKIIRNESSKGNVQEVKPTAAELASRKNSVQPESGWAKRYKANFIEPGVVRYQEFSPRDMVLVQNDALDKMARSFIGKPVIDVDHAEVSPSTLINGEGDGVVTDVWRGDDGWWWCEFIVWNPETIRHCDSGAWSVSCAYRDLAVGPGGTHHNVDYAEEILDGEYTHLAVVEKPRYEGARILANSNGEHGGYKMALSWFKKEKPAARLNAGAVPEEALVKVDDGLVSPKDLFAALDEEEAMKKNVIDGGDEDEIELDGRKAKLGSLRAAHRNKMKRNSEKEKKEMEAKKNADLAGQDKDDEAKKKEALAKEEKQSEAPDSDEAEEAAEKDEAKNDVGNPDKAEESAEAKNAAEEEEEKKLAENRRNARFNRLRELANSRPAPLGGEISASGPVTVEDRLARGRARWGTTPKE